MNDTPVVNDRRIIPRWRDSKTTQLSGELLSLLPGSKNIVDTTSLENKAIIWQVEHQIESAAELVSSAFSQGIFPLGIEAAEFILQNEIDVTPAVASIAKQLLLTVGRLPKVENPDLSALPINRDATIVNIHILRSLLNVYPNNPLMWVDLSQSYTILGQLQQSLAAMRKALILAPNNRFVLRSSARLLIHLDEPDQANRILLDKQITQYDPWLLAAEIATATVAGKTSSLIKLGRHILGGGKFLPSHTAELASALATLELINGANKKARKLFEQSLIDPNDNSVAQSVWAKRWLPTLDTDIAIRKTPKVYEAKAWEAMLAVQWDELLHSAQAWSIDEPFSSRPAEIGSFAAAVGLEDFSLAISICTNALLANPKDPSLMNNLAFALANNGRLDEARNVLDSVKYPIQSQAAEITITATRGLVCIRDGKILEGQEYYLQAISLAKQTSNYHYYALGNIYYAREMLLAKAISKSDALSLAEDASAFSPDPIVLFLLERLKKQSIE